MSATLLYVADPMCSWCWGFAPVLASVTEDLRDDVSVRYVMGGLAPDSDEPMEEAMKEYIRGAWRSVTERAGVRFNWSYWEMASPRRSTWPACRAVVAARQQSPELGWRLFEAIQRAYYLEARNPSDLEVLVGAARTLAPDLDLPRFEAELDGPQVRALFEADRRLAAELGAHGFPWLGEVGTEGVRVLSAGWSPAEEVLGRLATAPWEKTGFLPPEGPAAD